MRHAKYLASFSFSCSCTAFSRTHNAHAHRGEVAFSLQQCSVVRRSLEISGYIGNPADSERRVVRHREATEGMTRIELSLTRRLHSPKDSLVEVVRAAPVPAPHHDEIVFGIDPDDVGSGAQRSKASARRVRPRLAFGVEPPEVAVVRAGLPARGSVSDPGLRNDLAIAPLPLAQHQIAEARVIASTHPQTPAPTGAATDGYHLLAIDLDIGIVVAVVDPGIRRTDRVHDLGLQHVRQRPLPDTKQRQ